MSQLWPVAGFFVVILIVAFTIVVSVYVIRRTKKPPRAWTPSGWRTSRPRPYLARCPSARSCEPCYSTRLLKSGRAQP